jgi:hypothetical protein
MQSAIQTMTHLEAYDHSHFPMAKNNRFLTVLPLDPLDFIGRTFGISGEDSLQSPERLRRHSLTRCYEVRLI